MEQIVHSIKQIAHSYIEHKQFAKSNSIVVHLYFVFSDGESRTGVFIALDLLVRDGEKFGLISVLDCVRTLREQRDNMVQNKVQGVI